MRRIFVKLKLYYGTALFDDRNGRRKGLSRLSFSFVKK